MVCVSTQQRLRSARVRGVAVIAKITTKQTTYFIQCKYDTKWIIIITKINNNLKKLIMSKVNELKSKRFVVRKSLIGKNTVITVNFKNGKSVKYNHDVAYKLLKNNLEKLACFAKYKSYTATNNIPVALRGKELL
tara:strand:+ start:215 stop:619 length:405 start_codon:yes stop_codon:yes gene_type:complete